jgi:hypothetical protein
MLPSGWCGAAGPLDEDDRLSVVVVSCRLGRGHGTPAHVRVQRPAAPAAPIIASDKYAEWRIGTNQHHADPMNPQRGD